MSSVKLINKVGKSSRTIFKNTKAFRVITVDEMIEAASKLDDCHIVVIERIKQEEYNRTREFIEKYKENKDNYVVFYVNDLEEVTSGLADEMGLDLFTDVNALYNELKRITGVEVSNRILVKDKDKERSNKINWDNEVDSDNSDMASEEEEETFEIDEDSKEEAVEERTEAVVTEEENKEVNSELMAEIASSNKRIEELNKLVRALKDEKEDLQKEIDEFMNSDEVLEDPISLEEYREMQEFNNKASRSIESLEHKVDTLSEDIKSKEEEIKNKEEKLERLSNENKELSKEKEELVRKSAENEDANKTLAKYVERIEYLEEVEEDIRNELDRYKKKCEQIRNENTEIENVLSDEISARYEVLEINKLALEDIAEKSRVISDLEYKKNELERENEELRKDVDRASDNSENIELKDKIRKLEGQIDVVKGERDRIAQSLSRVESEYKGTLESMGGKENVETLKATNDTLSNVNEKLREQISSLEDSGRTLDSENIELRARLKALEAQNEQLKNNMSSMAGISNGSAKVARFDYNGKAKILNVFGYGSYGVTTTAMSIARELAKDSPVVIVELDMTAHGLEYWVKVDPMRSSGYQELDSRKATSIGVLANKGYDSWLQYNGKVQSFMYKKVVRIDYVIGSYEVLDDAKIASIEYSKLLEYLGSMYKYIVVDCGKVSESITKNSLINAMYCVASDNVMVANGESLASIIRAIEEVSMAGIDIRNINLVANKIKSDSIMNSVAKLCNDKEPKTMIGLPYDATVAGYNRAFTDCMTTSKLNGLISNMR